MKKLNLHECAEVSEFHGTNKVNVHTATVRPGTKFMDPCKHLNMQLPPAMPAVDVHIQYCCTEVHFHSHMY